MTGRQQRDVTALTSHGWMLRGLSMTAWWGRRGESERLRPVPYALFLGARSLFRRQLNICITFGDAVAFAEDVLELVVDVGNGGGSRQ